jgi:hypothetical protein
VPSPARAVDGPRGIALAPQSRHLDRMQKHRTKPSKPMASDVASSSAAKDSVETITVIVRKLPEGVWLAVNDDLLGLIVETQTREEAIDLSPALALELLKENGERTARTRPKFVFVFS